MLVNEKILSELNQAVVESNEPMEGSLFYMNLSSDFKITNAFESKRNTIKEIVKTSNTMLEIGFNAGHSALLILTTNPFIKLTCVDINEHRYTEPCGKILSKYFEDRFKLLLKDSKDLIRSELKVDTIHVDGDHSKKGCYSDLLIISKNALQNTIVILDDWELSSVKEAFEMIEDRFLIQNELYNQLILRVK